MNTEILRDMMLFLGIPILIGLIVGFYLSILKPKKKVIMPEFQSRVFQCNEILVPELGINSDKKISKVLKNIKICNFVSLK